MYVCMYMYCRGWEFLEYMDPAKAGSGTLFDYFYWVEESASGLRTLDSDSDGEISMAEFLSYAVRPSYNLIHWLLQ